MLRQFCRVFTRCSIHRPPQLFIIPLMFPFHHSISFLWAFFCSTDCCPLFTAPSISPSSPTSRHPRPPSHFILIHHLTSSSSTTSRHPRPPSHVILIHHLTSFSFAIIHIISHHQRKRDLLSFISTTSFSSFLPSFLSFFLPFFFPFFLSSFLPSFLLHFTTNASH